jgi:hypothetical protein
MISALLPSSSFLFGSFHTEVLDYLLHECVNIEPGNYAADSSLTDQPIRIESQHERYIIQCQQKANAFGHALALRMTPYTKEKLPPFFMHSYWLNIEVDELLPLLSYFFRAAGSVPSASALFHSQLTKQSDSVFVADDSNSEKGVTT